MNRKQRVTLLITVILLAASGLFLPWRMVQGGGRYLQTLTYGFLLVPPHFRYRYYAPKEELQRYLDDMAFLQHAGFNKVLSDEEILDCLVQRIKTKAKDSATYRTIADARARAREFEQWYGAPGELHGNWWWKTQPWSEVEPRLDLVRLHSQ